MKNNQFIDDVVMGQKKMNESDKSDNIIEDEKEGKIEDIIKGLDYFSEYQRDDSFDEKITCYITRKITKQIFMIQKIKKEKIKKKGRRNSKETFLFKSKHDKNSSDNIRKKIKRQFIKSIIKYINQLLQKNQKSKILIYKIIPDFCNAPKKEDNNKYLSMTLRELFSSDLGNKFKNINKDYNKNNIEKLYKKNKPEEIINFFALALKILASSIPLFFSISFKSLYKLKSGISSLIYIS